jgi:hypothetical protein
MPSLDSPPFGDPAVEALPFARQAAREDVVARDIPICRRKK